jgi:hypothetical protein
LTIKNFFHRHVLFRIRKTHPASERQQIHDLVPRPLGKDVIYNALQKHPKYFSIVISGTISIKSIQGLFYFSVGYLCAQNKVYISIFYVNCILREKT